MLCKKGKLHATPGMRANPVPHTETQMSSPMSLGTVLVSHVLYTPLKRLPSFPIPSPFATAASWER